MSKYILGHRAQTRSVAVRYIVLIGLLLVAAAVLQVSFFSRFRLFGAVPDLMICTVLCLSFFSGRYTGAITGIAGGFLIEAIGSSGLTLLPLFYLFFGYLIGHYSRAIIPRRYTSYLVYLGFAVLLRVSLTLLYACMTYQSIELSIFFVRTMLPEAAVTAAAGSLLYFPMLLLCRVLEKRK